jgi:hypothetical protein
VKFSKDYKSGYEPIEIQRFQEEILQAVDDEIDNEEN